jgi:hypothetical protein
VFRLSQMDHAIILGILSDISLSLCYCMFILLMHTHIHTYIYTYAHSICLQLFSLPNKMRNCFSITKTSWFMCLGKKLMFCSENCMELINAVFRINARSQPQTSKPNQTKPNQTFFYPRTINSTIFLQLMMK